MAHPSLPLTYLFPPLGGALSLPWPAFDVGHAGWVGVPAEGGSQMQAFARALSVHAQADLLDPAALHAWSVANFREFWAFLVAHLWEPLGLAGSAQPVCEGDDCETSVFFPGLRLNYAQALLSEAVAPDDAPALTECRAEGGRRCWSRGQLRAEVESVAAGLARLGVQPGDRVVALARNDGNAVVAALAVTALGATLSTAAPDMGVQAILDRFAPLAPRWLLTHTAAREFDAGQPLAQRVLALEQGLPTLEAVVRLDGPPLPTRRPQVALADLAVGPEAGGFTWRAFGFNHPLFILFSSGTTGRPKCIVHGAGGSLLEHVKEHRLHTDLRPRDRLYFHTGCGWMMWNWQLSALASGAQIVTYDGPIDQVDRLWRLVADERVTVFGTSPAYLRMCEEAQLAPRRDVKLDALRAILSTGAILHERQYDWVAREVGPLPLQSICGGTDILGCFVLGHPDLPVRPGLAQCRSLAMDVQAWQEGAPASGVGHLVCTNPFPSRPLGFFGDADGSRFHAAYFQANPGVWTHGDLVEFSPEGGARLHGRCDGVINVRGIKFAPAEVDRVLADLPGIQASMVVEQQGEAGAAPRVVALLVLKPGTALDSALVGRVRREIAQRLTSAHVPDLVLAVEDLPVTHSGKLSEAAVRCAVNGGMPDNLGALRNPQCLAAIQAHPGLVRHAARDLSSPGEGAALEQQLQGLWQDILGMETVGLDDHFFDLGGSSLAAASLVGRVRALTGCVIPLSALLRAPTIRQLARLIEGQAVAPTASDTLVPMRPGQGRPLFLVHGLSGTVMECWPLVRALRTARPVWGLQAQGLDGEARPHDSVEAMATHYVDAIRAQQPHGPYALCGFSFGGLVVVEMARQLAGAGEPLELVAMIDSYVHRVPPWGLGWAWRSARAARKLARAPRGARFGVVAGWLRRACQFATRRRQAPAHELVSSMMTAQRWDAMTVPQQQVYLALCQAFRRHEPQPFTHAPLVWIRARLPQDGFFESAPVWRRVAAAGLQAVWIPGSHLALVTDQAPLTGAALDAALGPPEGLRPAGGSP